MAPPTGSETMIGPPPNDKNFNIMPIWRCMKDSTSFDRLAPPKISFALLKRRLAPSKTCR